MTLQHPTMDLIVRDNYFSKVYIGFEFQLDSDNSLQTVGRLVLQENCIDLDTSGTPVGITLDGEAASPGRFKQVILRKNQIRHKDGAAGPSDTYGIDLDSILAGIVEENLVSIGANPDAPDAAKAIKRSASAKIKTFNNQSSSGVFLPSTYGSPTRQDPDLVAEAQDWLLGV